VAAALEKNWRPGAAFAWHMDTGKLLATDIDSGREWAPRPNTQLFMVGHKVNLHHAKTLGKCELAEDCSTRLSVGIDSQHEM